MKQGIEVTIPSALLLLSRTGSAILGSRPGLLTYTLLLFPNTNAMIQYIELDMRYPPGKLPQPKPNLALGGLGWPHLIPVTRWAG